ncbi:MAG: hypothetical protein DYH13_07670 [Alphaproteobacteria bacterium PRO2]|nr:hypothetical protein [Alphaproteobacteria bacterium PRO2]
MIKKISNIKNIKAGILFAICLCASPSNAQQPQQNPCGDQKLMLQTMAEKIELLENERARLHASGMQQTPLPVPRSMEDAKEYRAMAARVRALEEENYTLRSQINDLAAPAAQPPEAQPEAQSINEIELEPVKIDPDPENILN